jgi:uroporphyrinogen-III synthase
VSSALAGRRIVVTRARDQAESFAHALESRGAKPIYFPTISIRAMEDTRLLDAAVRAIDSYAWVVFTSANAVTAFWERMTAGGRGAVPDSVRIASIGPASSATLAALGIAVDAQPARFVGSEIAGVMGDIRGAKVLLPRADDAREETVDALRAAGGEVDDLVAYRTVTGSPDPAAFAAMNGQLDAVTFTSPSGVRGFCTLLGDRAFAIAASTPVVTIGPTTSSAVRETGWPEPIEAKISTVDGIVAALEAYFARALESQGAAQ